MEAPPEKHAFVAALNPPESKLNDAILVVDVDPDSDRYGQRVGEVKMPKFGDELHHFGWNACSSALCPYAPHPHVERRYLVVPGLRSSRMHIIDTKPDPKNPKEVKVIDCVSLPTAKDCRCCTAWANSPLPAWSARTVQDPAPVKLTVAPETEHTAGVPEENDTGRPELALA